MMPLGAFVRVDFAGGGIGLGASTAGSGMFTGGGGVGTH